MSKPLSVPRSLQHLIEKRETPDRRAGQRRAKAERRQADLGPLGSLESAANLDAAAVEERRVRPDRRRKATRRARRRRKTDGK